MGLGTTGAIGARRRRLSWKAVLVAPLCVGFVLLVAASVAAQGLPDLPATSGAAESLPDLPTPPATADQSDSPTPPAAAEQPDSPGITAWYDCATGEAAHLDDGRSDAATIADALATSCQSEWDASKAEQCKASDLAPAACAILSDKLDANRRSYQIKVVLALRAKKAQVPSP